MYLDTGQDLLVPIDEVQPAFEVLAHKVYHVLYLHGALEMLPARVAAGPEGHLLFLKHERGRGELLQVPNVIVVEVGKDHARNPRAVYAEFPQPLRWAAQMVP